MPIYEYRCLKCGKTFEALQSISSEPICKCIHCGGKTKKIVSLSSFQLKGKGWYKTDYKKSSESEKAPSTRGDTAGDPPQKAASKKNKDASIN